MIVFAMNQTASAPAGYAVNRSRYRSAGNHATSDCHESRRPIKAYGCPDLIICNSLRLSHFGLLPELCLTGVNLYGRRVNLLSKIHWNCYIDPKELSEVSKVRKRKQPAISDRPLMVDIAERDLSNIPGSMLCGDILLCGQDYIMARCSRFPRRRPHVLFPEK